MATCLMVQERAVEEEEEGEALLHSESAKSAPQQQSKKKNKKGKAKKKGTGGPSDRNVTASSEVATGIEASKQGGKAMNDEIDLLISELNLTTVCVWQ